jgi:ribosomal protein L37AE/L43A
MGDRTWWEEPCPKCGKSIEMYDAPSSLIWSCHCDHCGYDDGRSYYEIGDNELFLGTEEQYQNRLKQLNEIK